MERSIAEVVITLRDSEEGVLLLLDSEPELEAVLETAIANGEDVTPAQYAGLAALRFITQEIFDFSSP